MSDERADELASGPDGGGSARSPWIWRGAGLLAVGVVAVLVGPGLLSSPGGHRENPASPPGPAASGNQAAPLGALPAKPLSDWRPRGPGLGADFVAAALARMRVEGRHVDQVLWAGSLDGHDRIVVVSYHMAQAQRAADDIEIGALRVRQASQVATAHSVTIGYVGQAEDLVGTAWHGDDNHTRLLLLTYPEPRRVQISAAVDYHPSGNITRQWRDAALADGAQVMDLGRDVDPVVVVRPASLTSRTGPVLVDVEGRPAPPGARKVVVAGARSASYEGPATGTLVESLSAAMRTFCDLRAADSRVVWSGRLTIGRGESGKPARVRAALVVVRRPDGATFQAFVYAHRGDIRGISLASPVGWSVADRLPYAFAVQRHMVLINPSGPGSAVVTPAVGPTFRVQLDDNGVARVASPYLAGARVVVRDPSGHRVLRATLVNTIKADIFGFGL